MPSAPAIAARPSLGERIGAAFGVDDPWERPRPPIERLDIITAAVVAFIGLISLELVRSFGTFDELSAPVWLQWLATISGAVLLVWRRRWPLLVALLAATHMLVVGIAMPMVMGQFPLQAAYFVAFLSAVAWARDRRAMLVVVGVIVVVMFAWLALQFAIGSAIQDVIDGMEGQDPSGWIGAIPASVILTVIVNAVFFGGAFWGGQVLWRDARAKAMLEKQAATIAAQSEELRDQAITEERLRIARELHDVVAHHVSVIGVQAAAARRVIARDADAATTALANIESSSREAVTSMRGLLGTLRQIHAVPDRDGDRQPEPSLEQLPDLVASAQSTTRSATYALVESDPGAAALIPSPIAHSIYRTAQEALTNTAKHSTATEVRVTVRVELGNGSGAGNGTSSYAEVEIIDNGRPRGEATLGTGLGQLGIRERAASHRAQAEIGPRPTGGYRVRVRYPMPDVSRSDVSRSDVAGSDVARSEVARSEVAGSGVVGSGASRQDAGKRGTPSAPGRTATSPAGGEDVA